jgi:hypothetical protein
MIAALIYGRANNAVVEGTINRGAASSSRISMGSLTTLSILALIAHVEETQVQDEIRLFRTTPEYACLVQQVGRRYAEEFILDVQSGWDAEHLAQKYLSHRQ